MLVNMAESLAVNFAARHLGARTVGPVTEALLTSGAALALTRGKRTLGLALLGAGGVLLWRQVAQHGTRQNPPAADAGADGVQRTGPAAGKA